MSVRLQRAPRWKGERFLLDRKNHSAKVSSCPLTVDFALQIVSASYAPTLGGSAEYHVRRSRRLLHVSQRPMRSSRLANEDKAGRRHQDGHACGSSYMTSGSYCVPKSPQSARRPLQTG